MKKILAVVMVVATLALSSTAVMAAPTNGAAHAADQAGLFAKVLSFFATLVGDTTPATNGRGQGQAPSKVQSPGNTTNEGAIWACIRYGVC